MIKKLTKAARLFAFNSPFIPVVAFSSLFFPFFGLTPCFDAIAFFEYAKVFYTDGLNQYLHVRGLHPPFPAFILFLFFKILGPYITTVSLSGYLHGVIGIVAMYYLTKKLFGKQVAIISAILLAICPIFIANSVHMLIDFTTTVYLLLALSLYSNKKLFLYSLTSSMLVLTKDTGLLLPASVITIELYHNYKELFLHINVKQICRFFLLSIPIILYGAWVYYVSFHGLQVWHDNIFAETRDKGAFITIFHNVLTFDFFNKWAIRHRTILFYMNFNWVFWLIAIAGTIVYIKTNGLRNAIASFSSNTDTAKTKIIILLFCISYFFTVLTFQTFTAPRYDLPILVFLYMFVAWTIKNTLSKAPFYILLLFAVFTFVRLFYSIDPISNFLFEKRGVNDQVIYYFDDAVDGNDIIVYNLQYLFMIKNRARDINYYNSRKENSNKKITDQRVCWFYY